MEIPKEFPVNSQRIPKKFPKKSHMWILQLPTLHLDAENPFRFVLQLAAEKKTPFLEQLKQIFGPSYTPIRYKRYYLFHYFSLMKSSENRFYFFTCILPDYVAYERPKEFWKNSHFENMRAGFLLRCQNSLRFFTPEMMHFQPWKKNILANIMS
jgi:hypothetical protein